MIAATTMTGAEERREDDADNRNGHQRAVIKIEIIVVVMPAGHRHAGRTRDAEVAIQFLLRHSV